MNDDRLETMSDEQLQQQAASLQRERNAIMTEIENSRGRLSKVNSKLELVLAEVGRRNYETMMNSFVLTPDHLTLLREFGAVDAQEIPASDLQIADLLGWKYDDAGLSERQESNIARLLSELKYAQSFINKHADGLVNVEKASE